MSDAMRIALEKISGKREYDAEDHAASALYKREEGWWTTDEYLADAALAATPAVGGHEWCCGTPEKPYCDCKPIISASTTPAVGWQSSEDGVGALTPERWSATPAVSGEPVAWRFRSSNNTIHSREWSLSEHCPGEFNCYDIEYEPLYAAQPASPLRGREDNALNVVRQMIDAYDSGNLQMSSPEIGEPENNIPIHQWHEELLYYARAALASPTEQPAGRIAFCDKCNGNQIHYRSKIINGVQTFLCPVCSALEETP